MRPTISAIELALDDVLIAGIRQHDTSMDSQPKMLCVHGWLDNANSFIPLMPYLPAFDLVAIDLPGHGYSSALPGGYYYQELGFLLYRIMDALGWSECHLMGHSLGGGFVPLVAVATPPSVQSLVVIEACGALSESADRMPERLQRAFNDRLDTQRFESRLFKNKQDAVDARLRAARMEASSAKLIVDRQLEKTDKGYKWRFDKRWRFASPVYHTEEQVQAVLKAIDCPVLTVVADQGFLVDRKETQARLACIKHNKIITLPGNHHVHMDTPEPVAAAINQFLATTPALGG